jgi:hypothetical protein
MAADDAEQTWADDVPTWLGRVADTALRPEDSCAGGDILRLCDFGEP